MSGHHNYLGKSDDKTTKSTWLGGGKEAPPNMARHIRITIRQHELKKLQGHGVIDKSVARIRHFKAKGERRSP